MAARKSFDESARKAPKMKTLSGLMIATVVVAFPVTARAVDVSFEGTHLCCGQCVKAVAAALKKVEGVSEAKCDREKKTVTFKAADSKAARGGVIALFRAGFAGTVKIDGKARKRRTRKRKDAPKVAKATLRGLHVCCGQCVKAIEKAVKTVKGVEEVAIDKKKRTVTVTGAGIDVKAVIAALHKSGFNARYGKKRKKRKAE